MWLQKNFVESKLATKFGTFNIRIYKDHQDKEHAVLCSEDLDTTQPVLVRVHSECLTGDMLSSLHCDCGKQLLKSLEMIREQKGVLIYLRQEGRGIGLFEKIKTYQLQSKGYDTFEANVLLGHAPDSRSYTIVKTILDDLQISSIKLITNNPSKVSDISKLGIHVVERVPIITRANKHNKKYLKTKKNKFRHLFERSPQHYFYQFHVNTHEQTQEIIEYIKDKVTDPLLKICVGISPNSSLLKDPKEIERVNLIAQACQAHPDFIPVIHYSFDNPETLLDDATQIKANWPNISRVQLNDLRTLEMPILKKLNDLFTIDIPLSDSDFGIVQNPEFIEFVKENQIFILIDNSKGKGIREAKESMMKKIDALLSFGLNNIVLCGGFGPDALDTYFQMQRFYRCNFSIDAETKLKTNGLFDTQKIKHYLFQLIRSDEPKEEGILQTKKFLEKHRSNDESQTEILGHNFLVHPKVFNAGHFPSSAWFASEISKLLKNQSDFCEVGCGAGVISCIAALSNPTLQIVATDINPHASENTKTNATRLNVHDRISAFTGDVLDGIDPKLQFDSIFWALPFGFMDPGTPIDLEEAQFFDPGYRAIRKLLKTAKAYLQPKGKIFLGFSTDLGHYGLLENLAKEVNASIKIISKTTIQEDVKLRFEILELSYGEESKTPAEQF